MPRVPSRAELLLSPPYIVGYGSIISKDISRNEIYYDIEDIVFQGKKHILSGEITESEGFLTNNKCINITIYEPEILKDFSNNIITIHKLLLIKETTSGSCLKSKSVIYINTNIR